MPASAAAKQLYQLAIGQSLSKVHLFDYMVPDVKYLFAIVVGFWLRPQASSSNSGAKWEERRGEEANGRS